MNKQKIVVRDGRMGQNDGRHIAQNVHLNLARQFCTSTTSTDEMLPLVHCEAFKQNKKGVNSLRA